MDVLVGRNGLRRAISKKFKAVTVRYLYIWVESKQRLSIWEIKSWRASRVLYWTKKGLQETSFYAWAKTNTMRLQQANWTENPLPSSSRQLLRTTTFNTRERSQTRDRASYIIPLKGHSKWWRRCVRTEQSCGRCHSTCVSMFRREKKKKKKK